MYEALKSLRDSQVLQLDHEVVRALLSANIQTQCWDRAAGLCQQLAHAHGGTEQSAELVQQLAAISPWLTDEFACAVEKAATNSSQLQTTLADLLPQLHQALVVHRQKLLLSPQSLSSSSLVENYSLVSRMSLPIRAAVAKQPQNLLSLFSTLQCLVKQEQTVRSTLQGSVPGVSCQLQPLHLRVADLISLFCPQFTSAFSHLLSMQQEAQQAVSEGEAIRPNRFDSEVGLQLHS